MRRWRAHQPVLVCAVARLCGNEARLGAFTDLASFILCQGRKNVEDQFAIAIACVGISRDARKINFRLSRLSTNSKCRQVSERVGQSSSPQCIFRSRLFATGLQLWPVQTLSALVFFVNMFAARNASHYKSSFRSIAKTRA